MVGRRSSITARTSEEGVAAVIGVILLLAVTVTVYAQTARSHIPEWGTTAEREWEDQVQASMRQLSSASASAAGDGVTIATTFPPPVEPEGVNIPMVGKLGPQPATGTLSFQPGCTKLFATHKAPNGTILTDLTGLSQGCVVFQGDTIYTHPFGYRSELGGLLRVEGSRAVVIAGPALELEKVSPAEYRVTLAVPALRGPASTASVSSVSARVDLQPGGAALETPLARNAGSATWTFDTAYPAAWNVWFGQSFAAAGFATGEYTVSCMPTDCSTAAGVGNVIVTIEGPSTTIADLTLSISYGVYDVTLK